MSAQDLALREDALIGRGRRPAVSGRYFDTLDPATEQTLAQVAEGESADVDAAVAAARAAFEGEWGHARPAERGHALLRLADLVRQNQEELIALESHDSGKPVSAIRRQDLPAVLDTLTYYAGWADKIHGQVIPARTDALTYTVREPIGVVGAIVPWNFPLMISMWKVAPALACGCTVVLKPAELTPLTALRMGELALQAGFPVRGAQCRARIRQDGGCGAGRAPRRGQGDLHRFPGRRAADPAQRRRQPQARHPRARRQVRQHRFSRRRSRRGRQGRQRRHLLQQRPGVLGWLAHPGTPGHPRRVRRAAGGSRPRPAHR